MLSIIIPAHNEESVLARGLRAILTGARPGELEVLVACNGCTDRTAEIARGFGPPVRVLEVPVASKIAALNAADAEATGFPRFYVDADVVLDLASIRAMAAVLKGGAVHFATPALRMDLSRTTWAVRAFYRVWTSLPYNCESAGVGTGVYAVTKTGRERFDCFPPVLGDDGFVRALFPPVERATVSDVAATVKAPRTMLALLRIQTRTRLGHYQLLRSRLPLVDIVPKTAWTFMKYVLKRPELWPSLPVFVTINVIARCRASRQLLSNNAEWERDNTSRTAV